ncbi:acyl-CoA dehydrogenase family protein [Streptomyces sp. NPDC057363]|uniref:acyl-CoA dehydrogenase family protein n=1 Tax=Streptomyces sp. NPDC057363 TaxID=3346107 RepID=UPI003633F54E
MTNPAPGGSISSLGLPEFAERFRQWMTDHQAELNPLFAPHSDYDLRVDAARRLRKLLFDHEWGRAGWPEGFGGAGGDPLFRAVLHDELHQAGWPGPAVFEHLEIIAPALIEFADPGFAAEVLPDFLDGSRSWSQGFSEPEAGSDLASLRTRATLDGDDLVVSGHKIWTSWSKWAHWCLALVRTGTAEQRHRGLSMIAIDLNSPGVQVRPIRQANGTDELAEVWFDDVRVPRRQLVGQVDGGWRVAMHLLARERGTVSWLRQGDFRQRLAASSKFFPENLDRQLGDVVLQLAGLRAAGATLLAREAAGQQLGPEAAYNKLLMTRTEQNLYNLLRDLDGVPVALPGTHTEHALLQQDYLFSRIVTIYGGSQQMQLITVARHILGLGNG